MLGDFISVSFIFLTCKMGIAALSCGIAVKNWVKLQWPFKRDDVTITVVIIITTIWWSLLCFYRLIHNAPACRIIFLGYCFILLSSPRTWIFSSGYTQPNSVRGGELVKAFLSLFHPLTLAAPHYSIYHLSVSLLYTNEFHSKMVKSVKIR